MDIDAIEYKTAQGELTASQVFTQMMQHVVQYRKELEAAERVIDILDGDPLMLEPGTQETLSNYKASKTKDSRAYFASLDSIQE